MNAKQKGEKILLMALRKGKIKCSKACPFYTESGVVQQFGGKKKTHCRGTMQPVVVDCNEFNPCEIETVEVTEKQWSLAQRIIGFIAKKIRRLYPEEHEEIHPVGWKSSNVQKFKSSNVLYSAEPHTIGKAVQKFKSSNV